MLLQCVVFVALLCCSGAHPCRPAANINISVNTEISININININPLALSSP